MERKVRDAVDEVVTHDLAEVSNLLLNEPLCLTLTNYAMRTPPFITGGHTGIAQVRMCVFKSRSCLYHIPH